MLNRASVKTADRPGDEHFSELGFVALEERRFLAAIVLAVALMLHAEE
jgi:hypothetical protein